MAYFDGEIEEPRRSAVAAFIAADRRASTKLSGLRVTSAFVQDQPARATAADDIADKVMARIASEAAPSRDAKIIPFPGSSAQPRVATPPQPLARPLPVARRGNDNARWFFGAVGLVAAAAAAAAFVLWGRTDTGSGAPSGSGPVAAVTAPTSAIVASAASTTSGAEPEIDAVAPAVSPEGDMEHGVEVAAVNFGAHMGSIFYVPSGSVEANRTTTVVWLADDAGE